MPTAHQALKMSRWSAEASRSRVRARATACLAAIIGLSLAGTAQADEQMVPLATSGDWMALSHRATMLAPPDVCVAINVLKKFFMRADGTTDDIRVSDDSWSLPTEVTGSISIVVGDYKKEMPVDWNTSSMVVAKVEEADLLGLIDAMDRGSQMTVAVGKAVRTLSLAGSTKVTNAFRVCAGLKTHAAPDGPSANPFE